MKMKIKRSVAPRFFASLMLAVVSIGMLPQAHAAQGMSPRLSVETEPQLAMGYSSSSPSRRSLHSGQGDRQLLFGDTHLHTTYSFDAYLNKNHTADPDTAYRWAKGLPVVHPSNRVRVQIETPLDFLVVSDHAEYMGFIRALDNGTLEQEDLGLWGNAKRWVMGYYMRRSIDDESGDSVFSSVLPKSAQQPGGDPVQDPANQMPDSPFGDTTAVETTAWSEIVDAADRHNAPGTFSALIGWEWSSLPTGANLHRVVFTPEDGTTAKQFLPFGSDQSQYPEDLWTFLEETEARTGARFIAIPHNSNLSKGYMYASTRLTGDPMDAAYAKRRMRWEPVSEVTQIKGDSETHPVVSPDDPFADFETFPYYLQQNAEPYDPGQADYIRGAYKTGLSLQYAIGANPYQFGMIGSTDSHSGLASAEERNFWGKFASDSTPEAKRASGAIGDGEANGWSMSAAGLAAVWSSGNTRDAIFEAFRRKETYATTGTRLKVRVFGGWRFPENALTSAEFATIGYRFGVPMGGLLTDARGRAPTFLIRAEKDPNDANLDRVQIVKGWVDAQGAEHERIYDVAWSGQSDGTRVLDADGHLPLVGSTVDLTTGRWEDSIGAPTLEVRWQDPAFNENEPAFYYVRVLQIPTPRHSLLDGIALGVEAPKEGPATLQERAYTSPIWYQPPSL